MTATRFDLGDRNEIMVDLNRDVDPGEPADVVLQVFDSSDTGVTWMPPARAREIGAELIRRADEAERHAMPDACMNGVCACPPQPDGFDQHLTALEIASICPETLPNGGEPE